MPNKHDWSPTEPKYTEEAKAKACEMKLAGNTRSEITKATGIPTGYLTFIFRKNGIPMAEVVDTKAVKAEAQTLRRQGMEVKAIAAKLDITLRSATRYCLGVQSPIGKKVSEDGSVYYKYTPEQKAKACEMRRNGAGFIEIEAETGIAEGTQAIIYTDEGIRLSDDQKSVLRTQYGPDFKARAIDLRNQLKSRLEIAKDLGCSLSTVKDLLKGHVIPKSQFKYYFTTYSQEQELQVIGLRKQGVKAKAIAETVGLNEWTVRTILASHDIVLTDEQWQNNLKTGSKYSWEDVRKGCAGTLLTPPQTLGTIERDVSNKNQSYPFFCNCGTTFYPNLHAIIYGNILSCGCLKSFKEIEVRRFIETLTPNVVAGSYDIIPPYQLDIYLPDLKIAIEFCGLYYHSEEFQDPDAHVRKLDMCEKLGVRLVTLFADEWLWNDGAEAKTHLESVISQDRTPIPNMSIRTLTAEEAKEFYQNRFSVEGIKIGDGDISVAVLSGTEIRHIVTFVPWEGRWAVLRSDCLVPEVLGTMGMIFDWVASAYSQDRFAVMVDRCWSDGSEYRAVGFKE